MNFSLPPITVYLLACLYLVLAILIHWQITFDPNILFFIFGALLGLHLFLLMEAFIFGKKFSYEASILHSVVTQVIITILAFFVLTSTDTYIGKGLVLFINLYLLYMQNEAKVQGRLASWFNNQMKLTASQQNWYIYILLFLFILETLLFVRL